MAGATLKQMAKKRFWKALEEYKEALRTGTNIVAASLAVHAAKSSVPKSYHVYVSRAFKSGGVDE